MHRKAAVEKRNRGRRGPQNANDTFAGCFASKDGEIIPLDGDTYSNNEEVLSYEEWSQPENDIQNGLTVVVKGEWISG